MNMLHILSTPRAEGTPNLVLDWLKTGNHRQSVMILNSTPNDLAEDLRTNCNWYQEHDFFSKGRLKFPLIVKAVYRACKYTKAEIVVSWPTGFSNWICAGAKLAGVSRILVHAGNPPNRGVFGDWMSRYGMWPIWMFGGKVVCCSKYVRSQFEAIPGIPRSIFYHVWNSARVEEVRSRALSARQICKSTFPVAIMVATLEKHKDHKTLLQAIPQVLLSFPNFKLKLVGDGTLRVELENYAKELGISNSVEFLGTRRDVPELLGCSNLFILSTTAQEGLGTVLIEALAAGVPVIATDVPACREILVGGRYGILVKEKSVEELSNSIIRSVRHQFLDDPLRIDFASTFSPSSMMDKYLSIAKVNETHG